MRRSEYAVWPGIGCHATVTAAATSTPDTVGSALAHPTTAIYQTVTNANLVPMSPQSLPSVGGDQPHNNLQPYLTFYFCIALQGVYPPRP